jgi:rhamnogalacturonyl hydrolase YesR
MKSENCKTNKLIIQFIGCLFVLSILNISTVIAEKPQYGAYPASLQPSKVSKLIVTVAEKYRTGNFELTPTSKELLKKAMIDVSFVTKNDSYVEISKAIEAKEVTKSDTVFSKVQNAQLELFRTISGLPAKDGKTVLNKAVSNSIVQNFKGQLDQADHSGLLKQILEQIKEKKLTDNITNGLFLYNATWGINQPVGMMWLDVYRVPVMRLYIALSACIDKKGNLKNKKSSVLDDAAFLLAACQVHKLSTDMSQPMLFVSTPQYSKDINTQKKLLAAMPMPDKEATIALMRKTAEAQLKNTFKGSAGDAKDADRSWYRGSFFTGIMSAWRATGDDWYLTQAEALAAKTKCEPGPNAMHDANDLNISQIYLELFEAGKAGQYKPTQLILDSLIKNYNPKKVEWSWCDALFMAPPTWARMGKITGDKKYFEHMDKLWWQTSDLIYDKEASLFQRDLTYTVQEDGFQIKERNGQKIYWGRGNGWVMGALPRVLEYLPADFVTRPKYEAMFKSICKKLLSIQGKDGLWRSSLLDTKSYPMGETSSTTFYCYAFAWGINHGLLDNKTYKPAAFKAWKALSALVNPETGRLEYVQLPADSPRSPVFKNCNVEYATGAYLLGGAEILKLMNNK